jgi:probable selenium-dependent hydroxylase accessory protein YqeC
MDVLTAFGISLDRCECIALVGGGGKTTTMFALARALKHSGGRVLVTTTTNIFMPDQNQYDRLLLSDAPDIAALDEIPSHTIFCLAGERMEGKNKLKSIAPDFLAQVHERRFFDALIAEADGARRLPIKAPAVYEPVIPPCATLVIGCIGLDALGTPVDEDHVHRTQLFCDITGARLHEPVEQDHIVRLISAPNGLFKGAPAAARKTLLLNKADTDEMRQQAHRLADTIADTDAAVSVVIASMAQATIHHHRQA